ncbi:hypothetical protein MAR_019146, partial [Mya arenaria]
MDKSDFDVTRPDSELLPENHEKAQSSPRQPDRVLKPCTRCAINRTRKRIRPHEPDCADFEIDMDFLAGLREEFYRVMVPASARRH